MSSQSQNEQDIILIDVQLKNGATVQVNIDQLGEFWEANADQVAIDYGKPRRPRKI